jgi:hypothetical protein
MAGNPLAKLFPYVKKYAVELYLLTGLYTYVSHQRNLSGTYKSLYSKFDFQRTYHIERLRNFVQNSDPKV